MVNKEEKGKKSSYFSLPTEDRIHFELEDKERKEKDIAAGKVFDNLNKGNKKTKYDK